MEAIKLTDIILMKKDMKIQSLPIEKIRSNPYQPRKYFSRTSLEELAVSISEYGVLQPIIVRKMSASNYELVAGERRLKASELVGLKTIPAIVVNISDLNSAFMALTENLQRQPLHFFDIAEGLQCLIEDYEIPLEELAICLGCSQGTLVNRLKLLKIGEKARKKIVEYHLTEQHAKWIAKLPEESDQLRVIDQIIEEDLTVKGTEELVEETMARIGNYETAKRKGKEKRLISDIRLFTNSIYQTVEIIQKSGRQVFYESRQDGDYCEILIKIHPKNT
ncbi:MAG: ParB/RepB/Spo0J family partition protein [Epulopiscium sp.]|nr:ParB/RepB/Spo0J family partition protein [Candidatus Epulonipiscium sp.]